MYLGDYAQNYPTVNFKFDTHGPDNSPITLVGGAISVYKANNTIESSAGVTLTIDFDGRTGLHNVLIDLSSDAFYAVGNDFAVVLTAGTVSGISVVGTVLAEFSIQNRYASASLTTLLGRIIGTLAAGTHNPQGGDTFARIGVNGAALTALGDARLADLDETLTAAVYAIIAAVPTTAQISDKYLGRNLAGGADGGRTVRDALRALRNKVIIDPVGGTITVYAEDDTATAWSGTVATSPGADPITGVDPS
jgi:hypothetical protein